MMTDADRAAAEARFRDEQGCGLKDAALAARALHPFDKDVESGEGFAREAAAVVRRFARDVSGLRGNQVGVAAERAVEELLEIARDHREMHYVMVLEDALDHAGGPVADPEPSE